MDGCRPFFCHFFLSETVGSKYDIHAFYYAWLYLSVNFKNFTFIFYICHAPWWVWQPFLVFGRSVPCFHRTFAIMEYIFDHFLLTATFPSGGNCQLQILYFYCHAHLWVWHQLDAIYAQILNIQTTFSTL